MTDKEEIERLIMRYGYIIDEKQWDRLGDLFTATGSFEVVGTESRAESLAEIDNFMRTVEHPLVHYSTNVLIDVDEGADVAKAQVKIFAPRADGTVILAKYNDDLVRTRGGWRFQRRLVVLTERSWRAAPRRRA